MCGVAVVCVPCFPVGGGAGFPWVSVRFLVLCGVFGGRGVGRTPSFFGAGGANVRENTAKTRCFESEKNEGTENEEKNKKQLPGATPSNEGVRKRRGGNVRENTSKTRCFEDEKNARNANPR